jgi:SET domain-containing protein
MQVNHSCQPSCGFRTAEGGGRDRILLLSYRELLPGEELTISYLGELYQPTHARRAQLLQASATDGC